MPPSATFWTAIAVPAKVLQCLTAGSSITNAYGYNYAVAGDTLQSVASPTTTFLTADANTTSCVSATLVPNVATAADKNIIFDVNGGDFATRHGGAVIASFVDGHVALSTPASLIPGLGDNSISGFGALPWGYYVGTSGAAATGASFLTSNPTQAGMTAMTTSSTAKSWNAASGVVAPTPYYTSSGCYITSDGTPGNLNFTPSNGGNRCPDLRYTYSGPIGTKLLVSMTFNTLGRNNGGSAGDSSNLAILHNWTSYADINPSNVASTAGSPAGFSGWTNMGTKVAQIPNSGTYTWYSSTYQTIMTTTASPDTIDFADPYIWDSNWTGFNLQVTVGAYTTGL